MRRQGDRRAQRTQGRTVTMHPRQRSLPRFLPPALTARQPPRGSQYGSLLASALGPWRTLYTSGKNFCGTELTGGEAGLGGC